MFLIASRFPTPLLACAFLSLRATKTSFSKLARDQTSNPTSFTNPTPKGRIHRSSKQKVENSYFKENLTPVATMTDNRTMAEMLRAPTEGCAEAIQKFDESFHEAWERYKDLLHACPHHGFTKLHKLDTFYNALNLADQDSLNAVAGGNLLEKSPQDAFTIIENKSKVCNSQSKPIASPVNACDNHSSSELAKLTHVVNQQTSAVTTAWNTFPEFRDNIQGYVSAATGNYNQGNPGYRPQGVANQMRPPGFAQPNVQNNQNRFGQPQGFNHGPNFNQEQPYQATTQSNQNFHLNELEKIKRMNDVSLKAMQNQIDMMKNELRRSGTLPGNTIANPKGKLKAITARSGLVTEGPTVPNPPKFVNPEEDECVEETYTDPDLAKYTIKVPPHPVQKPKPSIQRNFVLHTRDSLPPHIPELNCKALANLGASINLMPLSIWKKLGLPDLIPTRMTLELANRAICTPDGIARDVFVPVGKFTFPADFVVVDYESDPRVPLILGRPFLRTARALIDVHGEEMILRDGDERLTLNMKHDTASYSNHPHRDSVNLIYIFNLSSEDCLEDLVSNKQSGNPTFSLHKEIASPEVIHEIHDSKGCNFLSDELPDIDSFNDIHPHFDVDPLSGSTTDSANSSLEEFADELALITYPPDYDDNRKCDIESDLREIEFLLYQGEDSDFKDSIDQSDLANLDDLFVDPTPEMFIDEKPPDYSFPPRFDVYPDDFLEIESDADNFDDDLFDSKGEKIKESELLIDQLDLPCDILSEYDSFNS
nr:reverse transcriptase domain-containing protein [Tanacetum cinerariifolium]